MRRGLERWIGESTADLPLTPGSGRRRCREDSTLPGADRDRRASQSERGSARALPAAGAAASCRQAKFPQLVRLEGPRVSCARGPAEAGGAVQTLLISPPFFLPQPSASESTGICGAASLAIPRYAMIFKHSREPVLRLWL
ncbi:uncharacterized protein LOC129011378 isoform X2 [Pongo pygmaeus]|uniref:uncharacterized protein LOC129011378 isoform X2 n=1 Tax=Pongo pygmaeus TaxID=9600 RepID=UPI00300DB2F0